ncbi:nucleoside permease [Salmonella enterica subsp. enterica]|uniref:Nucleoside permease n=1 Tax=Salmonella enterica I TaxID=59201 RepID=A0A3S4IIH2_SALET|nr:nucleoside permease [Salmonella enterica subsp. enterica]
MSSVIRSCIDFARNPEFCRQLCGEVSLYLAFSFADGGSGLYPHHSVLPLNAFGIKTVMLMSMLAWTLRFGFFAFGDPSPFGFVLLPAVDDCLWLRI